MRCMPQPTPQTRTAYNWQSPLAEHNPTVSARSEPASKERPFNRELTPPGLPLSHPRNAPAGTFDGTWSTDFKGYFRNMLPQVRDGILHAETGIQGQAGYLALDDAIQPDGNAILTGHGRTGSRVETRRCDATFSRN